MKKQITITLLIDMDSRNPKEYKNPQDFVYDEARYALEHVPSGVFNRSFESGSGTKCTVHVKNIENKGL